MKCAIMQPTYLPWLGYFHLINQVEKFVFLDNVQVVKRSWDVRNRIKTVDGELYLTVPLKKTTSRNETTFVNAKIDYDQSWVKKHLRSIEVAYRKAKYFEEIYELIKECLSEKHNSLSELNSSIIVKFSEYLELKTEFLWASELKKIVGKKDALLVSICKEISCREYLSPVGAAVYIEAESAGGEFGRRELDLEYQTFKHPIYSQLFGKFVSHLSVVDAVMNCGVKVKIS
ncbi:WbqC family protein [Pseudomonadota bacterium]